MPNDGVLSGPEHFRQVGQAVNDAAGQGDPAPKPGLRVVFRDGPTWDFGRGAHVLQEGTLDDDSLDGIYDLSTVAIVTVTDTYLLPTGLIRCIIQPS